MANTQALATSFKVDILNGVHAFSVATGGKGTKDTFNGALVLASSSFGAGTSAYTGTVGSVSMSGEVATGGGYTAGGIAITNANVPASTGTTAYWSPSAALSWTGVTIATAFDAVLIFNNTVTGKNAVGVFTFGSTTVSAGNFTINFPAHDVTNGLIKIA